MSLQPVIRFASAWSSASAGWAVHLFEGTLTVAAMDRMQQIGDLWSGKNPGKRAELVIIFPSDARMSGDERTRMARLIKHGEARRAASATVILAEGLRGAMQRSTLTALMMVAHASHPVKVFGNVSDAVRWLFPYVQGLTHEFAAVDGMERELHQHLGEFGARVRSHAELATE
jgi:hypothetical protein